MTTPSGKPIPPRQRRLALLGSPSVGKSSLAIQYAEEHFVESYYPTIEQTFTKSLRYRNQEYTLEIVDTAGHNEFSILGSKQAHGLHGWALVYSIASRQSFEMVPIIRAKLLTETGEKSLPMVLIGNKSDLETQRQVSTKEGEDLAELYECAFVEASARNNFKVSEAFEKALAELEKTWNPDTAKPKENRCIVS